MRHPEAKGQRINDVLDILAHLAGEKFQVLEQIGQAVEMLANGQNA